VRRWFIRQPGSCSGRKSLDPTRLAAHRRRPRSEEHRAVISVSVIDLERLLSSPRISRSMARCPPHSADARQRLVYCSLHDVNCLVLRSDRKRHPHG